MAHYHRRQVRHEGGARLLASADMPPETVRTAPTFPTTTEDTMHHISDSFLSHFSWVSDSFIGPLTAAQADAKRFYLEYCAKNNLNPELALVDVLMA